ncbi:MAG: hypothetical protein J5932_05345 [Prevotella sp.]|nr:hypothetical protein [Prevotella sp.]
MRWNFLKASYGDCYFLYIDYADKVFTILVDGGPKSTYMRWDRGRLVGGCLKEELKSMLEHGEHIDLLIITHVDEDHIGGILSWFNDEVPSSDFVREVWMNDDTEVNISEGLNNTAAQAASLKKLLTDNGLTLRDQIVSGQTVTFDWGEIAILAPTAIHINVVAEKIAKAIDEAQKDNLNNALNDNYNKDIKDLLSEDWTMGDLSAENDASIAFMLTTKTGERGLFLGDANIDTVMCNLSAEHGMLHPLFCQLVKLSHHGSKNNFRPELLDVIKAEQYVVLTNGSYYGHPDKEVISQIIDNTDAQILFNYIERGHEMLTVQDKLDYPCILDRMKRTDVSR